MRTYAEAKTLADNRVSEVGSYAGGKARRVNVSDFEALRLSAVVVRAAIEGRVPHADVVRAAENALLQCKTLRAVGVTEYSDETGSGVWAIR